LRSVSLITIKEVAKWSPSKIKYFIDGTRIIVHQFLSTLYAIVQEPQTAEDLMQETFLKAYEKYDSIKEINKVKSFLYRAAHNATMDFFRKESRIKKILNAIKMKNNDQPSIEKIVEVKEEGRLILKALKSLKPTQREVVVLRRIHGFSIKETAEVLNWSEGKVKTTLHRANKNLEAILLREEEKNEQPSIIRL
jgi:RNA polymerase sigma-70 factor, ECF subfamily